MVLLLSFLLGLGVFFRIGAIVHFLILLTSAVLLFAFTFRVVGFVFSLGLGFLSAS